MVDGERPIRESADDLRKVRDETVSHDVEGLFDVVHEDVENLRRLVERAAAQAGDQDLLADLDAAVRPMLGAVRGLGDDLTASLTGAIDELDGLRRPVVNLSSVIPADRPLLRDPPPDTVVTLDESIVYTTDHRGRVIRVAATLAVTTPNQPRNKYAERTLVGKLPGDDAGHLVARILGGVGHKINLVPMERSVNRGQFASLERRWRRAIARNQIVDLKIEVRYEADTERPLVLTVTHQIGDGDPEAVIIENSSEGTRREHP